MRPVSAVAWRARDSAGGTERFAQLGENDDPGQEREAATTWIAGTRPSQPATSPARSALSDLSVEGQLSWDARIPDVARLSDGSTFTGRPLSWFRA
jgi:hypothetical protein